MPIKTQPPRGSGCAPANCDVVRTGVALPQHLLDILVCPKSKQRMIYFPRGEANLTEEDAFVVCPASALRYRVENGVPVLLVDEAAAVTPDVLARLVARARSLGFPVP